MNPGVCTEWILEQLERERNLNGLPPKQPLLQLENSSRTVCYSNSGTNLLMSSPQLSHFLAEVPSRLRLLGIVRGLARNQPHKVSSLTDLRKCVASLVPEGKQFLQPKEQDASEWLLILNEAIEKEDPKLAEEHMALQLQVVNSSTQQPLDSLLALLNNYFTREQVEKRCHACYFNKSWKQLSLALLPKVLLIQYMRFVRGDGRKLGHNIQGGTTLTVNGVDYRLRGVLVHQGISVMSGHYYNITRCCVTGNTYLTNDNAVPQRITPQQLSRFTSQAYILVFDRKPEAGNVRLALESQMGDPVEMINISLQ